jgi:citrate lyase subunit beta/citryl-CoA lyase
MNRPEPIRSWLYVPAHRIELLGKAMAGPADAVVLDLEDAVPAEAKRFAREQMVTALAQVWPKAVWVRVNPLESRWGAADLTALSGTSAAGLRLPKAEDPDQVRAVAQDSGLWVHAIIESALGVENAYRIATAHPGVALLSLGEADLMADLQLAEAESLGWARQRLVNAARAAGLPSPPLAAWTDVADVAGLSADTVAAGKLGFFGRSVLHPRQVEVVNSIFTPDPGDVAAARARLAGQTGRNDAAWLDEQGRFVDAALLANARWLVDLADAIARKEADA